MIELYSFYQYSVYEKAPEENRYTIKSARLYDLNDSWDIELVAQDAADDFYFEHDGWEVKSWPIIFHIWAPDDRYLGEFSVDMEMLPHFTACKVK